MRAALNCYGPVATGLGSEARWLWRSGFFDSWLVGHHPRLGYGPVPKEAGVFSIEPGEGRGWEHVLLGECDTLVCIERPLPLGLMVEAKRQRKRVVMLANPEWTRPDAPWIGLPDLLVARSALCERHLRSFARQEVRYLPVPIGLGEFPFTERHEARRVVFLNGWGGVRARKGWPEVESMLQLRPGCVEVQSQRPIEGWAGPQAGPVESGADLYAGADVVLVPSRFEGIGLSVLEGMASGAVVVATDAEPMSEFVRAAYGDLAELCLLPVSWVDSADVGGQAWWAHHVDAIAALDVLDRLRDLPEADVRRLSNAGREYVERVHGASAFERLFAAIGA